MENMQIGLQVRTPGRHRRQELMWVSGKKRGGGSICINVENEKKKHVEVLVATVWE